MRNQQEFINKAKELLGHNPEALEFVCIHNEFVHAVDDIVDEDLSPRQIVHKFLKVWQYYNHPYYLKHAGHGLSAMSFMNHVDYENSVEWEHSNEDWKKIAAATLRHTSISTLFLVIALECGVEAANKFASEFREHTFLAHLNDKEFKICPSSIATNPA